MRPRHAVLIGAVLGLFLVFRARKKAKAVTVALPKVPKEPNQSLPTGSIVTVAKAADSWSKLARDKFGDVALWPALWDLNRAAFPGEFGHPDDIEVGDRIFLPAALPSNEAFRAAIRARHHAYVKGDMLTVAAPTPFPEGW